MSYKKHSASTVTTEIPQIDLFGFTVGLGRALFEYIFFKFSLEKERANRIKIGTEREIMSNCKRRKLSNDDDEEVCHCEETEIQKDIKSRLTGFEKYCKMMKESNPDWILDREDLTLILRNEKQEEALRGIQNKYKLEKRRIGSRMWIKAVVDLYFKSYHDILSKRKVENSNIVEGIDETSIVLIRLNGIPVPEDVLLMVLSYVEFNTELILSLGRTCKKFYLLILRNWNSRIKIWIDKYSESSSTSSKRTNLYQISLLVLRSMKEVIFSNLRKKKDIHYLINQIKNKNRIQRITFRDCRIKDIIKFFQLSLENNVEFPNCQLIEFPHYTPQYGIYPNLKPLDELPSSISFSTLFPSLRSITNPLPGHLNRILSDDDPLRHLRHVCSQDTESCYEIIDHKNPDRLLTFKYFPDLNLEHYDITSINHILKNIVATFPRLETLHFFSSSYASHNNNRMEVDWDFLKECNSLRNLEIHFNRKTNNKTNQFFWSSMVNRRYNADFNIYLPKTLKKVKFSDPPLPLFLHGLESYWEMIEDISIVFTEYIRLTFFRNSESSPELIKDVNMMNEVARIFVTMPKKIKKVKVLCYYDVRRRRVSSQYVNFVRFEFSKKLKKIKMYLFNDKFMYKDYLDHIGDLCKQIVMSVRKIKLRSSNHGIPEEIGEIGEQQQKQLFYENLIVYFFSQKNSCENNLGGILPPGVKENESERLVVRNRKDSYVKVPNSYNLFGFVAFKRRSYYSK